MRPEELACVGGLEAWLEKESKRLTGGGDPKVLVPGIEHVRECLRLSAEGKYDDPPVYLNGPES